jgi:hypothetical protein
MERAPWSWLAIVAVLAVGGLVLRAGGNWLLAVAAMIGFVATFWQFFVPVDYEVGTPGLQRTALGRTRWVPWHAVQAYQLRMTGIVLYQRFDPTKLDLLRSLFVPYPADADEAICVMRHYLAHALELPE